MSTQQHSIQFNSKSFSFGRHETFALRFGWLTKGFQGLTINPDIFLDEDATVHLGVGKNMVSSIRYWMLATKIAEIKGSHIEASEIGHLIFSETGWDPYLEDEATIWLLHWLLASNSQHATAVYWFFNHFHKSEFSSDEMFGGMKEFVGERLEGKKVADSSLKHDCNILTRLYVPSQGDKRTPVEDALDSPLSTLGLMNKSELSNRYVSKPDGRWDIPLGVIGYAIGELFEASDQSSVAIEAIVHGTESMPGLGSTFRITEECLVSKIEELITWVPGVFELRESAGIYLLYQLEEMLPIEFLNMHYKAYEMEIAA
ncbi:DUF4007 family protein [Mariprofundus ferrinatatus]|nr:DUF4007 family protein [Mariprofundus ferrinatatus]